MKTKQVQYKITPNLTADRINTILKIKEKNGLTAEAVLNDAKKKTSPLHELFEWDDEKAGDLYRLQQARFIINEVKVVIEDKEYYAFENMKVNIGTAQEGRVYLSRSEVLGSSVLKKQFIQSAFQRVKYWKSQCEAYNGQAISEFLPIFSSIEQVEKTLSKK